MKKYFFKPWIIITNKLPFELILALQLTFKIGLDGHITSFVTLLNPRPVIKLTASVRITLILLSKQVFNEQMRICLVGDKRRLQLQC